MSDIRLDSRAAVRLLGDLGARLENFPEEFRNAVVRTLNRVGPSLRARAVQIARSRYAVKGADVQKKIYMGRASFTVPFVSIGGTGRPIHLGRWNVQKKTVRTAKGRRQAVSVKILREGRRKLIKGGFLGKSMKNGHQLVFIRQGKKRYPIEALYGPSIISLLARHNTLTELKEHGVTRLKIELRHEAERRLKKLEG